MPTELEGSPDSRGADEAESALAAFRRADAAYRKALEASQQLMDARDDALLRASSTGMTMRALARATDLSLSRVHQILERARAREGRTR